MAESPASVGTASSLPISPIYYLQVEATGARYVPCDQWIHSLTIHNSILSRVIWLAAAAADSLKWQSNLNFETPVYTCVGLGVPHTCPEFFSSPFQTLEVLMGKGISAPNIFALTTTLSAALLVPVAFLTEGISGKALQAWNVAVADVGEAGYYLLVSNALLSGLMHYLNNEVIVVVNHNLFFLCPCMHEHLLLSLR